MQLTINKNKVYCFFKNNYKKCMIFIFKYKILKFFQLSYMVIFIVVNLIILIFNISLINIKLLGGNNMNIDYISDLIEKYKSSSEYINTLMCDSEKDLQQFGVTKESLIAEKSVYNEVIHDLEHIVLTY